MAMEAVSSVHLPSSKISITIGKGSMGRGTILFIGGGARGETLLCLRVGGKKS